MKSHKLKTYAGMIPLVLLIFLCQGTIGFAQNSYKGWQTDLKRAAEISAKTNKPIFLVFRCVR